MVDYDVGIIGAGSAGLGTALQLTKEKNTCIIYDQYPLAQYSSTGNQGWLHSGSLYTIKNQFDVAMQCKIGFEQFHDLVKKFHSNAIRKTVDAYYLFKNREFFLETLKKFNEYYVKHEQISIGALTQKVRMLEDSKYKFAIKTFDKPIDTRGLLTLLLYHIQKRGCTLSMLGSKVTNLTFERIDDHWKINSENGTSTVKVIAVCAGAAIPQVLENINKNIPTNKFKITKVPVLSIKGDIENPILCVPYKEHHNTGQHPPSLVPFYNLQARGNTICFHNTAKVIDANEINKPEIDEKCLEKPFAELKENFPLLYNYVACRDCKSYVCHKIEFLGQQTKDQRRYFIIDHSLPEHGKTSNVLSMSSGKFTTSLIAADYYANLINQKLKKPLISLQKSVKIHFL